MGGLFDGVPPPPPPFPGQSPPPNRREWLTPALGAEDADRPPRPVISGRLASILGSADDSSDGIPSAYRTPDDQPSPPRPEAPAVPANAPTMSQAPAAGAKQSISNAGLEFIRDQEAADGYKAKIYPDSAGYPTIGYGHKLRPGEAKLFQHGIDEDIAEQLLAIDAAEAEAAVHEHVKVPITQQQHDALVSFVFNFDGNRFAKSTILRELNAGHSQRAADALRLWNKETKDEQLVPNKGLTARRERERNLFLNGRYK
jgi:lysozyme